MLNVLKREYGISQNEALTQYTEKQIQEMIQQLSADRVVMIHEGMKKQDIERRYLEAFFDHDNSTFMSNTDKYLLQDKRAKLKAKLLSEQNPEIKSQIQKEIDEINNQLK